jgi:hypothetical protein
MRTTMKIDQIKQLALRVFATFAYNAMAVIGSASLIGGIPVWKSALLAGVAAAAQVVQNLARAYSDDGILTAEEIEQAFGSVPSKKK